MQNNTFKCKKQGPVKLCFKRITMESKHYAIFWLFFTFFGKIDNKNVMVMYWQYFFQKVICNVIQYNFCNVATNVMQYILKVMFNSMTIP